MPMTNFPALWGRHVLLVEDDDGDAMLVQELLTDAFGEKISVLRVATLGEATAYLTSSQADGAACALVDLNLPDAQGLEALDAIRSAAPFEPVVVLTGLEDEVQGLRAVAAGAQDYLVKGRVDAQGLRRAIGYAMERRRADDASRLLLREQLLQQENHRLERGLLPLPLLDRHNELHWAARYRPGSDRLRIGGDFYDLVEANDVVHLLVGDVCGHGPDEAAIGVRMRVAWRALVRAGLDPVTVMEQLDDLMHVEALLPSQFTTAAMVRLLGPRQVGVVLAGHPPPLLVGDADTLAVEVKAGPPLGLGRGQQWTETLVDVPPDVRVVGYTDGLIEGRTRPGSSDRLGIDAVIEIIRQLHRQGIHGEAVLDALMAQTEERNGGPVDDDIAIISVELSSMNGAVGYEGG